MSNGEKSVLCGGAGEIAKHLGLSTQGFYELRRHLDFPEPAGSAGGRPVWLMSDVATWVESCRRSPSGRYVRPATELKYGRMDSLVEENRRLRELLQSREL